MSRLDRRGRGAALVVAPLFALMLVMGVASAAAALSFDDTPDPGTGYGLQVTVPGTASPSSSSSGTGGSSGGGYSGGSGPGSEASDSSSPSASPSATLKPNSGVLQVSGLSSTPQFSLNPGAGQLVESVTIQNESSSTFDCTVAFVLDSSVGTRISTAPIISVHHLKPGQTRTVQATLPAVGQWTLLHPSVTVTPPKKVDGVELSPVVRDQWVVVAPWLLLVIAIAGAAAFAIVLIVRVGFVVPVISRTA